MTSSFWAGMKRLFFGTMLIVLVILILACQGNAQRVDITPLPEGPSPVHTGVLSRPTGSGSIAAEIRSLVESGTPPFLSQALDMIHTRDLGNTEFGRVMITVIVYMIQKIYPDVQIKLPPADPPKTHEYTRILQAAEQGKYTAPSPESTDYLEYVLPFFALLSAIQKEAFLQAIPDIQKAKQLNPDSALAPYFLGIAYEHSGRLSEAETEYSLAYELSPECYPAILSMTRIMNVTGNREDALRLLSDLVVRYPDNIAIKREIALAYYHNQDWSRAEGAIEEILQRNNRDSEFLLMQAHVLVEQGQFLQAQTLLDLYSSINPSNRLYLFLRARIQVGGYRNRDSALNYLRSILQNDPDDDEVAIYTTRLLMESSRKEEQDEGRELLQRLLKKEFPSLILLSLEVEDAIRRGAWKEAGTYLEGLLQEQRSPRNLLFAYQIERGLGNKDEALAYARELYEQDPANDEGMIAYVSALIDMDRQNEAGQMIESRLTDLPAGNLKSRYYYLRSRLRKNEDLMMNDLRSSLFEDPRNLSALIAMFEIYHRRRDERRAVYYLKQAIALAPENPQVQRYEAEYSALLGTDN